jgi:hypothetical protein
MNRISRLFGVLAVGCALFVAGGCSSNYYTVKDPVNGQTYYTDEIDEMSGGAIKFTNQRTGSIVTIQNSVVKEINEQEYNTGKNAAK